MVKLICAGIIAAGWAIGASAPAKADTPAAEFVGDWSSACDAWGVAAVCTSNWHAGKHHSHLVQEYAIRREADGVLIFSGRGLYRFEDTDVDGMWEDSQGAVHELSGSFADGTLRIIWGSAQTEIGRSVYTRDAQGLSVRDSVLTETGWRQFMAVDYPAADRETAPASP